MLPYDDEYALGMRAKILNLARGTLDLARKINGFFDVSIITANVRTWMEDLQCPLTVIGTDEQELINLEQRGYQSMARLHLTLAREARQATSKRNHIKAFRLYAQISECPVSFFETSEGELQALAQDS